MARGPPVGEAISDPLRGTYILHPVLNGVRKKPTTVGRTRRMEGPPRATHSSGRLRGSLPAQLFCAPARIQRRIVSTSVGDNNVMSVDEHEVPPTPPGTVR